jgi:hypothetical protein
VLGLIGMIAGAVTAVIVAWKSDPPSAGPGAAAGRPPPGPDTSARVSWCCSSSVRAQERQRPRAHHERGPLSGLNCGSCCLTRPATTSPIAEWTTPDRMHRRVHAG